MAGKRQAKCQDTPGTPSTVDETVELIERATLELLREQGCWPA